MALCPEHPKRDQNPKFTPLSETTSITVCSIWESSPPGKFLCHPPLLTRCSVLRTFFLKLRSVLGIRCCPVTEFLDVLYLERGDFIALLLTRNPEIFKLGSGSSCSACLHNRSHRTISCWDFIVPNNKDQIVIA